MLGGSRTMKHDHINLGSIHYGRARAIEVESLNRLLRTRDMTKVVGNCP